MAIKKVFVVGAGLMGGGITQISATAGYQVTMRDIAQEPLDKAMKEIERSLGKFASKGKITEDQAKQAIENITTTTEMSAAADADLIVEAVFEKIELKQDVFKQLDEVCKPECILASNTSAISITSIASVTKHPENVVGTHFFSPVPMMKLCEVIRGLQTSDETIVAVLDFAKTIGKETVVVQKDVAGFIANRVGLAMSCVAIKLVEAGVATPEDIDKTMKLGFGHRMGPLETSDMTGIDVLMNAMKAIYNETQDERYAPPEIMQRMVAAGLLGRKTGKGWYDYSTGEQIAYWKM
ncbi:MAG TPA: 3-hydroxyacyl-CoA dehydrogenase family protein [Candidatus Anoxymicrobiaceae bacterium]|jgi:3-hydroxybutyryl-CoA dehydrogenase